MTQSDTAAGAASATPAARSRRKRRDPQGTMPLMEHIYELRKRLLIAVASIAVSTAFGFWWYSTSIFVVPSLGDVLTGPYCEIPAGSRLQLGAASDECRLLATGPFEQFMLRLKVGATAGVVLSSPVWLYQIWAFIVPGLHTKEKRYGVVFTLLAALLFVSGAVLAYVVVVQALSFLLSVGDNVQTTALSGSEYFSFIIHLILIFGVSFEIPLLIAMLNVVGVLPYETLKRSRRGIILGVFVFAAVASPGQDPFSMLALAVAVCVLVEVSIQFARFHDKRRSRERPDWMDVDDESASPISADGGIGGSGPLDAPRPVAPSGPVRPGPAHSGLGSAGPPTAAPRGPASYDDVI